MDLFHWRNLNKDCKFYPTKKQYFGRYLWRVEFNILKVHLVTADYIYDISKTVARELLEAQRLYQQHNLHAKKSGYQYYHLYNQLEEWEKVNAPALERIRSLMKEFNNTRMKFRIEGDRLQIYTETEDDLKEICDAICFPESIKNITGPKEGTEDALRNGEVYMAKIDHKFKIMLRDGNYDFETKQHILNQLSQRKDIKIPRAVERELGKKYPALWGAYIYANDDSIITILSLIAPGIVGKIHPVAHFQ